MPSSNVRSRIPCRYYYIIVNCVIILLMTSGRTSSAAPVIYAPQPTHPENNTYTTTESDPPLGVPSFSWSAASGANVYRLQVDSDIGFTQPVILDITTRNLSYTPQLMDHLFYDGGWFWRVRVEDPAPVSDWSPTMRFTKNWATAANKPDLIAPTEGELLSFFDTPAFSWTPVSGAAGYQFLVSTTPMGFDHPLLSVDTLSTSYQPPGRLANGIYYWRVVPQDAAGHPGTPSSVQPFTASFGTQLTDMVPTLIDPADETFPIFTPTFRWAGIEGAEYYRLEYTPDANCNFNVGTSLETRQTSYTPSDTFSNGDRYCWRVRLESGPAAGDWSDIWHFQKRWDLKPVLLTPINHYQTALYPTFSWTPVPGAARYLIEISENIDFDPVYEEAITTNSSYAPQAKYEGIDQYWWRVTPIDGGGGVGATSDASDFQSVYTSLAPSLISPFYYYQPNNYPGIDMTPHEDRIVALPIFQWRRLLKPAPVSGDFAHAHRIQVADNPNFTPLEWDYDTENTSATPISVDDFLPIAGQDYYWRVCPLDTLGGTCLKIPGSESIWWSQVWKARFDPSLELEPTTGQSPELLRPASGQEFVEATPLLEWWPYQGATQYQIEISREPGFSTNQISETVNLPAYSPSYSLAQRSLDRTDYGTFYWRVRGINEDGLSDWSSIWRFQIASQSEWRYSRTSGSAENRLIIGDDLADDAGSIYDLTTLYASQSHDYWYLGFNANLSTAEVTYVFYIDVDNIEGSGASSPPRGDYSVTTVSEHQPEFVIYVDVFEGLINNQNTWIFAWDGSSWGFGQSLMDFVGSVYVADGYVELKIPNSAIGMTPDTSSFSIILFSVDNSNGIVQDTVPSDPQVPGDAILSSFSAVSEHMNLLYPSNTATGDPATLASVLPFYWDWPTGSSSSSPFVGSVLQVDRDQDYTAPHEISITVTSNTSHLGISSISVPDDIAGDDIYYWRVQPKYWLYGHQPELGAWTDGWSFHRAGFVAQNLHISTSSSTPTFHWDLAEGTETYRLQVASDANFTSILIDISTPNNSYTPTDSLPQGNYSWRVQIRRYGNIENAWSEIEQFTLSYPAPGGLIPDWVVIQYAPTFCWDPLAGDDQSAFTAWKYHVQVSTEASFDSIIDQIDTANNCWTPTIGYADGTYYWRVASIINENKDMGNYSVPATFTKQYPITPLISPNNGRASATPTFSWTPIAGAATYIFEISRYASFSSLQDSVETINTRYTPTSIYETDTKYYWRVAIRDRNGNLGPFTEANFTIYNYIYLPILIR